MLLGGPPRGGIPCGPPCGVFGRPFGLNGIYAPFGGGPCCGGLRELAYGLFTKVGGPLPSIGDGPGVRRPTDGGGPILFAVPGLGIGPIWYVLVGRGGCW